MSPYFDVISIIKWIFLFSHLLSHKSFGHKIIPKIKICVIGAGPAGIATTRHLAEHLNKFEITVFERSYEVGGNWLYTDKTGIDKYGYPVHSSIYKNLRTNTPKELLNFPDRPEYKNVNVSMVAHYIVLEYLKNYTDHFQLKKFIEFNTIVKNVKLHKVRNSDKWKVVVKNLKTAKTTARIFDAVIVCNGHFATPKIPKIPGLKHFKGTVLHSHDYRKPEYFKNKRVIVLGGGPSGIDIGKDLKNVASKVYLSHNQKQISVKLTQVKGVDRFSNGKFILKDNSTITADALIFCTGYLYKYPFLDSSIRLKIHGNSISPIYKGIVHVDHPTLNFVGIYWGIGGFPRFFAQAQYVASLLSGGFHLPSKKVMLKNSNFYTSIRNQSANYLDSWDYPYELARLGGFEPIPTYYRRGYKIWINFIKDHFEDYKNYNLVISDDKTSIKVVRQ